MPTPSAPAATTQDLLTRLPSLTDPLRQAFTSQFTDAECLALGAQTRSGSVRNAALTWAGDADAALRGPHAGDIDYAPERLAWLVELIVALDAARDAAGLTGTGKSAIRTERELARAKATALRKRLISKLSRVVKGDEASEAVLAGNAPPNDPELSASLKKLAGLVDTVTATADSPLAILARSAKVTAKDAVDARAAAAALSKSSDGVALGGRAQGDRDTPEVNLVEGRVLKELLFLRDAMDEAHSRGVPVPALVPATGVRNVLAHTHGSKSSESKAKSPSEAKSETKPGGPKA